MSFTIWDRTSLSAFFPWPDGSECPLKKALSYDYFPLATKKIEANLPYVSDEGKITSALFYESCCSWNHRKNCFSKISRKRKSCVSYEREHSCGCFYRLVCSSDLFNEWGFFPALSAFDPLVGEKSWLPSFELLATLVREIPFCYRLKRRLAALNTVCPKSYCPYVIGACWVRDFWLSSVWTA